MESKNPVTRSQDFRQPAYRSADVLSDAGARRRIHPAPLWRDGCDVNSRNPSSDRLAGAREICHLFFLLRNPPGEIAGTGRRSISHRAVEREPVDFRGQHGFYRITEPIAAPE